MHTATTLRENFRQSDSGFWYPAQIPSRRWGFTQTGTFTLDPNLIPITARIQIGPADPSWSDSLFQAPEVIEAPVIQISAKQLRDAIKRYQQASDPNH